MGNVYMEADQVRFKDSTYRNVQTALAAALEGGGGGGTTVVANPEGSATADLSKLQVGTTIYGIPAEAGDISYDNTSSGMTADDVQEAIDELNTGIGGITELIPSDATSSNKLATADDIPDAVVGNPSGSATAGNLTKLQIGSDVYNVPSGGGESYSASETVIGTWLGNVLYRKVIEVGALPNATAKQVQTGLSSINVVNIRGFAATPQEGTGAQTISLPYVSTVAAENNVTLISDTGGSNLLVTTGSDRSAFTTSYAVIEYTKNS